MKSIILTGIKHCGKSTQARLIAKELNIQNFDTDDVITELTGKSPRQIYTELGAEGFMKAEIQACQHLKDTLKEEKAVIATGGGICNNSAALTILKSMGTFVFLDVDEATACDRIIDEIVIDQEGMKNLPAYIAKKNPHTLEDVRTIFHDFFIEREQIYQQIADVTVKTGHHSKKTNCRQIIESLKA